MLRSLLLSSIITIAGSLVLPAIAMAQTPQYYTAYTTSGGTIAHPFKDDTTNNKSQFIYKASDFNSPPAGIIKSVWVKAILVASGTPTYYNFTIKMKRFTPDTLCSVLPCTFETGLTTVFYAPVYTFPPMVVDKWVEIPLQTQFPITPESNLLVEMSQGPALPTNWFQPKCFGASGQHRRTSGKQASANVTNININSIPYFGINLVVNNTGVGSINGQELSVYPVPTTTELNITGAPSGSRYTIADITGRRLTTGIIMSSKPVDVNALNIGLYVLNINYEGQTASVKFAKQ